MVKTWSDRFEEGLNPFIERFNASIAFDFCLLEEDLDGSIAHAKMLGLQGIISIEESPCQSICKNFLSIFGENVTSFSS